MTDSDHGAATIGEHAPTLKRFGRWFYGWNVIAVALLAAAATLGVVIASFTFFAMAWMDEFGISRGRAMLALSAAQIAGGFLYPVVGYLMDRYPMRWIGVAGILCLAAGLLLASVATNHWQLLLVYALVFSCADTLAGPMLAKTLAAKWFRARRGFALGIASLGMAIGTFVFPPLTAWLLESLGWRGAMLALACGVTALCVPLLLVVVRNSPQEKGVAPEAESATAAAAGTSWSARAVLRSRAFWCLVIAFLPLLELTTALTANLGPYTRDLGIDTQHAALLLSVWSATMIVGKVAFGALADRINHQTLFAIGLALFALAMLLLASGPSFALLLVTIFLLGLSSGGQLPLVGAIISSQFGPAAFGTVMGLFYLCIRPLALAAPAAGWIRDTFGSYDPLFLGVLVWALISAPAIRRATAR